MTQDDVQHPGRKASLALAIVSFFVLIGGSALFALWVVGHGYMLISIFSHSLGAQTAAVGFITSHMEEFNHARFVGGGTGALLALWTWYYLVVRTLFYDSTRSQMAIKFNRYDVERMLLAAIAFAAILASGYLGALYIWFEAEVYIRQYPQATSVLESAYEQFQYLPKSDGALTYALIGSLTGAALGAWLWACFLIRTGLVGNKSSASITWNSTTTVRFSESTVGKWLLSIINKGKR